MKNEKYTEEKKSIDGVCWLLVYFGLGAFFAIYYTVCIKSPKNTLLEFLTFIFILFFTVFICTFLHLYIEDKFINYYDKRKKIIKENAIREEAEKAKQEAEKLRAQSQIWVNE